MSKRKAMYVNKKGKTRKIKPLKLKYRNRKCIGCGKIFKTGTRKRYCPSCWKKYGFR